MSGVSPNKRPKFGGSKNPQKFYKNVATKNYLEVGFRGFLATTNFREKECVRECCNVLNNYADELYGSEKLDFADESSVKKTDSVTTDSAEATAKKTDAADDDDEEEDIATTLANEIKSVAAANSQNNKKRRFNNVFTGASNCVFIKTALRDPQKLAVHIIRDVAETRKPITRNVLRFVPVEAVCKANLFDIKNAAGQLFDKYFLNVPPTTYSIVYNKRCNNDLNRDEIIRELADLVDGKNREHKVDLKNGNLAVLVEIVKGLCCLSVLPDYMKLKKYNLAELMSVGKPEKGKVIETEEKVTEKKTEVDESVETTEPAVLTE